MHSRAVIKSDFSVSSVHGSKCKNMTSIIYDVGIRPGSGVFKTDAENVPFPRAFSRRKYRFTCSFSSKISNFQVCFYAITAIKHDFLMQLTFARSLGKS